MNSEQHLMLRRIDLSLVATALVRAVAFGVALTALIASVIRNPAEVLGLRDFCLLTISGLLLVCASNNSTSKAISFDFGSASGRFAAVMIALVLLGLLGGKPFELVSLLFTLLFSVAFELFRSSKATPPERK